MGWTYNTIKQTRKEYIEEFISDLQYKLNTKTDLYLDGYSIRNNEIWVSWANHNLKVMYLILFKIECYKGTWGNKAIDITMGPYSISIPPKKFLKYPLFFKNKIAEEYIEEYKSQYK